MNNGDTNHETPQPSADLFWQAARYVWGELTPDEAAAFEERLTTDELACAAVAEAVTMSAGLTASVQPAVVAGRAKVSWQTTSHRRLAVGLCAAAMALFGFILLSTWQPPRPSSTDLAVIELVGRWTSDGHIGLNGEGDYRDDADHDAEIVDESLSAPHWLLDAVQLTSEGQPRIP